MERFFLFKVKHTQNTARASTHAKKDFALEEIKLCVNRDLSVLLKSSVTLPGMACIVKM